MKIYIKAIGKLKSPDLSGLIKMYTQRLSEKVIFEEHELKKKLIGPALKEAEGDLLLQKVPEDAYVIALDERGENLSSPDFAALLHHKKLHLSVPFVFLIGGADGLSEAVRRRADFAMSFGKLTWPHMMVRLMLIEQLYRAQQINMGHPYHKI